MSEHSSTLVNVGRIDIGVAQPRTELDDVANASHQRGVSRHSRQSQLGWLAVLVLVFAAAAGVRLYKLAVPGVLVDRDFTSAMFARDFYFHATSGVEAWRREMATTLRRQQPVLEPPVTDFLTAGLYWLAGREDMRLGRLLTSSFWLIGGIILYRLIARIGAREAALLGTIYYLFVPSAILLSRSFQPDALMMLMFIGSLYTMWRYFEEPSGQRLVLAAVLASTTLLHRPLVLFALMGAFAALAIAQWGISGLFRGRTWLYGALSVAPALAYYGYGTVVAGFMQWKVQTSFRPDLLLHRELWAGWSHEFLSELGGGALVGACLGFAFMRRRLPRALILGLTAGYVVFGLVFTMHIHTHGYYQAQLIPVVAIPLGTVLSDVLRELRAKCASWYAWLPVAAAVVLIAFMWQENLRDRLGTQVFESEPIAKEIGAVTHHSKHVVFLAPFYGMPLQYYGELTGAHWPHSTEHWPYGKPGATQRSIAERLANLGFTPEYFVITDFRLFAQYHPDLRAYLSNACTLIAQRRQYQIYSSCQQPVGPIASR